MKVLIVSDTHGYNDVMWDVVKKEEPFDMMIHCGDIECDYEHIRHRIDCPLFVVAGNNDYDPDMDRVKTFNIGRLNCVLTHGHRFNIYNGYDSLFYFAMENHADICFFGHTHVPAIKTAGNVTLINPGSLTYPRQAGRVPTYIVMTMEPGKEPVFEIRNP